MAVVKKVELQDHDGNIVHPHTETCVVFTKTGKSLDDVLEETISAEDVKTILEEEE